MRASLASGSRRRKGLLTMSLALRTRLALSAVASCLALLAFNPALARDTDYRLPRDSRAQLVDCAGAYLATAMIQPDAARRSALVDRAASFSSAVTEFERSEPKAMQGEVAQSASRFTAIRQKDPRRADAILKGCEAIFLIGDLYLRKTEGTDR